MSLYIRLQSRMGHRNRLFLGLAEAVGKASLSAGALACGARRVQLSAVERTPRAAWAASAVASAAASTAAVATATGIAEAATTAATAALGHAVDAGAHRVGLTTAPVARIAMAGIAVAHMGAQVGVGAWRLRIVMAMAAAATVLAWAPAPCRCWLCTTSRTRALAATGATALAGTLAATRVAAAGASTPTGWP